MTFQTQKTGEQKQRKFPLGFSLGQIHPGFVDFNKYIESYVDSYTLKLKKDELLYINNSIMRRIYQIQNKFNEQHEDSRVGNENISKRKRRLADDIERCYQCHAQRCNKTYGTLGSLQQHQRLKHPQIVIESSSERPSNE